MKRRVLSIILSIVMVCGLLPMTSYAATTITTVAITDMDVPIAGKTPDYAITTGVGYDVTSEFDDNIKTVSGVKWHNYTSDREMRPTETFEFGKQYAVEIFLRVENGYEFAYNSDSETSVLGTINGENANVIAKVTNNHVKDAIVVRYVFKACENPRIETIEVSGIDVPAVGKPADFDDPIVLVGAIDHYEPRCRHCHEI